MKTRPFLLHALSPVHAGTGQASGVVDLPTARMKATGIPFMPGSSIKGVLRDARRDIDRGKTEAVFGPWDDPAAHAGALAVADARLLALPVRSYRGTFAWTTSPLLLFLARRDLRADLPVPSIPGRGARVTPGSLCVVRNGKECVYLEDLDLPAEESRDLEKWTSLLAPLASPGQDNIFSQRFVVVDDETMSFLWDTGLQVDTRVRLGPTTRTVASGALWLEESLQAETLLLGLLAADRSRRAGLVMSPDEVLTFALPGEEVLQFGGKVTTGRGRCRITPIALEEGTSRGKA